MTLTVTLQANGAADPPTGTVSLTVNGSTPPGCGSVQVTGLTGTCTVAPLNAGTYTLTATYNSDSEYVATETQITNGTASLGPLSNLAVGTNQITAAYSGNDA